MIQTTGIAAAGSSAQSNNSSGGGWLDTISSDVKWIVAGVIAVAIWKSIAHSAPVAKDVIKARGAAKVAKAMAGKR